MKYPLKMTFMLYGGGEPRIAPALVRIIMWLSRNSDFEMRYAMRKSSWNVELKEISNGKVHLVPRSIPWDEVPENRYVGLLWSCEDKPNCPSGAGYIWGPTDYGSGKRIGVISVPYKVWWDNWQPHAGFETGFEVAVLHELKTLLWATLLDDHGVRIKNTYKTDNPVGWLDCDSFPSRSDCYKAFFAQLTPDMYRLLSLPPKLSGTPISSLQIEERVNLLEKQMADLRS